jgi:hypothetical protein
MTMPGDEAGKPEIYLFDGDLPETVDAIEAVLVERDPQICQRDGVLYVELPGGPIRANAALLRIRTMRVVHFYKLDLTRRVYIKPVDPALRYFEALLRKAEWKFPALKTGGASEDR